MNPLRTWWESRAAPTPTDYTSLRIADATARVSGEQGARGTAAYVACRGLISRSVSAATLEGEFSEVLGPHLAAIGRELADTGESTWELRLGLDGLALIPCSIATVSGNSDPREWRYLLTRHGPTESASIEREAAGVLAFRINADGRTPYRGRGALAASNTTGALLAEIECQLVRESQVKPTRILTAGSVGKQASEIEDSVKRGGIVSILQAGATASITDPSGLKAGVLKNESSASVVALYGQLERAVCAAMGVPAGLILSGGDGAAAREQFRFFSASTVSPILRAVQTEWGQKVAPLQFNLDGLRASDETARARALGSRSAAFKNLVAGGLDIERALSLSGLNDT